MIIVDENFLKLKEVYVNLKNYDFDALGNYKMDQREAQKIIDYVDSRNNLPVSKVFHKEDKN